MVEGKNPFSADLIIQLRHEAGNFYEFPQDSISMMLYPPWTIPFILPFGLLNFEFFRIVWLLIHIILVIISTKLIWSYYKGPTDRLWLGFLVALTFEPTILLLGIGHFTTLSLMGLIGFLILIKKGNRSKWFDVAAGASVCLATIKPQLLIIFLLALLFWILHGKRFLVILGGALGLIISSVLMLIFNPSIFHNYWVAVSQYPLGAWATPTIGAVGRLLLGYEKEFLQIFPLFLGSIWVTFYWWKRKESWNWQEESPVLVLASVVTSAYIWTYDMILLLLPVLQVVIISINCHQSKARNYLLFILFFVNILVLISHVYINEFWFFWFPTFITIWYFFGRNLNLEKHANYEFIIPD